MLGALAVRKGTGGAIVAGLLRLLPQFVTDDAKLWHFRELKLACRVRARDPVPALRVGQHAYAVVSKAADVDRVVQNTDHPRLIADDSIRSPFTAPGGRNAVEVQAVRNQLTAAPRDILGEDPDNDFGLLGIDPAPAGFQLTLFVQLANDVVAVAKPAGEGRIINESTSFELQVAEVPQPAEGDALVVGGLIVGDQIIGGEPFTLFGDPILDLERISWTCGAEPD